MASRILRLKEGSSASSPRKARCQCPAVSPVSDAEMATLNVTPVAFHGEWNYTIRPRRSI